MKIGSWIGLVSAIALAIHVAACGAAKDSVTPKAAGDLTADQIDADPLSLLPGSAIAVASADARAFYQSGSFGAQVSAIAEKLVPLGDEAGFSASRDADRVTIAAYSTQGADVAGVITGRFDQAKIEQAAQNHTPTKGGGVLTSSPYAGKTLYTVSDVGFTIVTPHTALAGTKTGMRRALDRIQAGHLQRDILPWMIATIETKDASLAFAVDLTNGLTVTAIQGLPLPWLQGLRMARVIGNFHDPGMNIAGTLTYADAQTAQVGANGLQQAGAMVNVAALTGYVPQLKNLSINVVDTNVECKFAVDDQALRSLLQQLPQWVPMAR